MAARGFQKAPDSYRAWLKFFHWSSLILLTLLLGLGNTIILKYSLALVVASWIICVSAYGILAAPGPKLAGILHKAFKPVHFALIIFLGFTAITVVRSDVGPLTGGVRVQCLIAFGAGLLHGCFHLWRHTALGDGALRNMLPKFMHGFL
ncbi:MAG: hypothetical protein WBV78_11650 [Roseobacter sp.]